MALLKAGKRQEAIQMLNATIASHPADLAPALYSAAALYLEDGNWQAAKPLAEQLTRLRPSSFDSWQLAIQAEQAAGDTDARDAAINALYAAWHSALDQNIQSRVSFARERIFGPKHTLIAAQTLEPGGGDIVLFVFQPVGEGVNPAHLMVVGSDDETNQRWREDGTVSYGTLVYHLDSIERLPDGHAVVRPYEYYVEKPSYSQIRAKVAAILAGTAQPLSGTADPYWAGDTAKSP